MLPLTERAKFGCGYSQGGDHSASRCTRGVAGIFPAAADPREMSSRRRRAIRAALSTQKAGLGGARPSPVVAGNTTGTMKYRQSGRTRRAPGSEIAACASTGMRCSRRQHGSGEKPYLVMTVSRATRASARVRQEPDRSLAFAFPSARNMRSRFGDQASRSAHADCKPSRRPCEQRVPKRRRDRLRDHSHGAIVPLFSCAEQRIIGGYGSRRALATTLFVRTKTAAGSARPSAARETPRRRRSAAERPAPSCLPAPLPCRAR